MLNPSACGLKSSDGMSRAETQNKGLGSRSRYVQVAALMLGDFVLTSAGLIVGLFLNNLEFSHPTFGLIYIAAPLMLVFGISCGVYHRESLVQYGAAISSIFKASACTYSSALFALFAFQQTQQISRLSLAVGIVSSTLLTTMMHGVLVLFNRRNTGPLAERVLVLEDGLTASRSEHRETMELVDFDVFAALDDPALLDNLGKLMKGMDRVVVACSPDRRQAWSDLLRSMDAQTELIDGWARELGVIGVSELDGEPTLIVSAHPLDAKDRVLKRIFDVGVACGVIILTIPVMVAISIAIFIEDGGPILFRQERVGQGNRSFTMYKFRSMFVARADERALELTRRNDARVTRVGRFIRAASLDELPQLFNVLLGQMSLVGPRPHAPMAKAGGAHYWQVDSRYWQRHKLKPGLTGLAQVRGFRGATDHADSLRDRLRADLEYLVNWSIWRDIRIICATVLVLIHPQAY